MDSTSILTILISILSSSIFTLILSTLFFDPFKDRKKYIFEEKQRIYISIITFAQIALYPKETGFVATIEYETKDMNLTERSDIALNNIQIFIPRVALLTKNPRLITPINNFLKEQNEESFNLMIDVLRKDLFK
ncbi:hypothetical protein [Listeria ivanovii]|uniref:hypothetical protein n=1 Tax=Listeria ivanovii TaxID=1638 RepID=UPI000512941B|nr:hypothetical protein [Listeria ivanovii]AIS62346.1 hypothetical protein JL53_06255 [Listeria ivanovii subsp. londoniensis]MBK1965265.1 hypothetical protein [Listeria ivanovii subsp. londoniensis]MBK1984719.1 hypothetical protein [Listeria ivanovii subsp. londoniensis]MBK1994432.1 hypothetical protein [Listeria ivanovii subsp. londoniensis]